MNPALPHTYYVYLLLSDKGGHIYIGCTANLERRINEHEAGKVFSAKRYLPMSLVYYETYISRVDAFNREKSLKQYGSALAKLKLRLKDTLQGGRAG
ncbi:MAG: GIY-YIG nuclease family protein [Candidatus Omnitrophica bacterium]|jgi:putative endonuclease|nr:GIY-YIG nuclease family protein [Candidatus Omnitrophota bacterium]